MNGKMCACPHHKIIPLMVILFGLDFLLGALGVVSERFVATTWPIVIMLAGGMKLMGRTCKCC